MARPTAPGNEPQPRLLPRKLRQRFPLHGTVSRSALTSTALVSHVAEALCREWYGDREHGAVPDARFWEQFQSESRVAVQAYLDALEEAGYRVIEPGD